MLPELDLGVYSYVSRTQIQVFVINFECPGSHTVVSNVYKNSCLFKYMLMTPRNHVHPTGRRVDPNVHSPYERQLTGRAVCVFLAYAATRAKSINLRLLSLALNEGPICQSFLL